jgi:hypothetical protein
VPQANSALYLGFTPDPAERPRLFPRQMRFRVFRPLATEAGRPRLCRGDAPRPRPPVTLVWEYRHPDDRNTPQRWRRLTTFDDESVAFTREGYIIVEGPEQIAATAEGLLPGEPRYWLRCRLDQGTYPAGQSLEIDFIRANAVPARNLSTVRDEPVGISDGRPDQKEFKLRRTPVQPGSLELSIQAPGQDAEVWRRVDDLLGSGPRDQHYVLNANAGSIRFGDGRRGEIPVARAEIVARVYRYGGGEGGNVGAGEINAPTSNLLGVAAVTNPRPAVGGRNEQSVEDLRIEAPGRIRCRNRAVSAEDYEALAVEAGGVARARALAGWHPDYPGVSVPGALTLAIVPNTRDMPPIPSPDLLATVCGYLEPRRTLTAEVYLASPTYIRISVEARVAARPYRSTEAVMQDVLDKLGEFLDPLGQVDDPPVAQPDQPAAAKPARRGWPFGQDLHPTRLYSVILGVEGVESVDTLAIRVNEIPHEKLTDAVPVPPDGLVYGKDHRIDVVPAVDL